MSVLFQALNRAARDYRDQQSPLVVPFLPLAPKPARARFIWITFAVAMILTAVVLHSLWKPAQTNGTIPAMMTALDPAIPAETSGTQSSDPVVDGLQPFDPQEALLAQAPAPAAAEVSAPAPEAANDPAAAIQQVPMHGETVSSGPQGIALPVDSLAVPTLDDSAAIEVAQQTPKEPVKEPAVAEAKKIKVPAAHVIVKEANAPSVPGLLREAHVHVTAKRYGKAIDLYDKALAQDGNNQDAWDGKIYALQQTGTAKAQEGLKKMAESRPFSAPVHAALALVMIRQGDLKSALGSWRRAVELNPADKTYLLSFAVLHDQMGHDAEALALYRKLPPPLSAEVQHRLDYLAAQEGSKGPP